MIKEFSTYKDFFHYMNWYEGDLIVRGNTIFDYNRNLIAKLIIT